MPSRTCRSSSPHCAGPPSSTTAGASSTRRRCAALAGSATRRSVMARILVLGGAGFIGYHLTEPAALADLPHAWEQVYVLAAAVGVRNAAADPARVIRVNTLATLSVLE